MGMNQLPESYGPKKMGDEMMTELFDKTGGFFAFSQEQLSEKIRSGVEYVSLGAGLVVPKENAKELNEGLAEISKQVVKMDLDVNGKEGIIRRELENHECYYTCDIEDCVDALQGYNITVEEIQAVFRGESLPEKSEVEVVPGAEMAKVGQGRTLQSIENEEQGYPKIVDLQDVPPVECEYLVGDAVTYTNYRGISFSGHRVIGFSEDKDSSGRFIYLDTDCYWSPVAPTSLTKDVARGKGASPQP